MMDVTELVRGRIARLDRGFAEVKAALAIQLLGAKRRRTVTPEQREALSNRLAAARASRSVQEVA